MRSKVAKMRKGQAFTQNFGMQDVTIWAMKDVRELSVSDVSLEPAARSARSAAFATAAACIAATQDKESLFANPLKPPGKTADPAGGPSHPFCRLRIPSFQISPNSRLLFDKVLFCNSSFLDCCESR